jgi:hypothetical protein
MRTALTLSLITLLALSGCVAEPPVVLPSEEPSSSPVFASDEEALAAAEEAYGAYVAIYDRLLSEGGIDPEPLRLKVSDALFADIVDGMAIYSDRGWRTDGTSTFDSLELQQHAQDGNTASVVVYLCADVSTVRILDSSGADVTPERQDRVPLEVEFSFIAPTDSLLERSEVWTGADYCE